MSGYENAPATVMVATSCACCARPLVDAVSVETGVGPDCRKKHGYAQPDVAVDALAVVSALASSLPAEVFLALSGKTEARDAANVLVHRVALEQDGPLIASYVSALHKLGFVKLAARIATRIGKITVTEEGAFYVVETPYNEGFVSAVRGLQGRRFDRTRGANLVSRNERARLWGILKTHFPSGTVVYGARGCLVL